MELSYKLETFVGPLDLLLHLIEKNKVNIYDIPIAEITDQYLDYVNHMEEESLDVVSEFLVMAATLLDIKARMLLPKEVNEDGEEEDSSKVQYHKLLDYRKLLEYLSSKCKVTEEVITNIRHIIYYPDSYETEIVNAIGEMSQALVSTDFNDPSQVDKLKKRLTKYVETYFINPNLYLKSQPKPVNPEFEEEEEEEAESQSMSNIFPEIGTRADRIDQDMAMLRTKRILPDDIIEVLPKYYRIADDPECAPRELNQFEIREVRDMVDDIIHNLDSIAEDRSLTIETPKAEAEVSNIQKYISKIRVYEGIESDIEADFEKDVNRENTNNNIFSSPKEHMSHKTSKATKAIDDDDGIIDGGEEDEDEGDTEVESEAEAEAPTLAKYKYVRTPVKAPIAYGGKSLKEVPGSVHRPKSKYTKEQQYDYVRVPIESRSGLMGKRSGKDFTNVKGHLDKFGNLALSADSSAFKKNFLDMVINGNFRVKYIPAAAARDTAEEYCLKHLDENGVPKYRLLPTNSIDPLGNNITDLNGDRVDDIILVDKRGTPAIVNGYKLVHASPYKKVWKTICNTKAKRQATPFNVWLMQQFNKDVANVDWDRGEYILKKSQDLNTLETAYGDLGLGKARISKRLSPNSYWASLFSHIWKIFWSNNTYNKYIKIRKLTNFLTVCNAIYVYYFDIPMKLAVEKKSARGKSFNYPDWSNWRSTHKQTYQKNVGPKVQAWIKIIDKAINRKTGDLKKGDVPNELSDMLDFVEEVVFQWGFGYKFDEGIKSEKGKTSFYGNLVTFARTAPPAELKKARQGFIDNINALIEYELYGEGSGYIEMKNQNKLERASRKNKAMQYNVTYEGE